jgi:hypothetical protein
MVKYMVVLDEEEVDEVEGYLTALLESKELNGYKEFGECKRLRDELQEIIERR